MNSSNKASNQTANTTESTIDRMRHARRSVEGRKMKAIRKTVGMMLMSGVLAAHAYANPFGQEPIPIIPGHQHWETLEFVGDTDLYTFEITQPEGAAVELWTIGYDLYANTGMYLVRDTQDPKYDAWPSFEEYDEHSGYNQYSAMWFECGKNPLPQGKYFLYVWDMGRYDNQPDVANYSINFLLNETCMPQDSIEQYNSFSNTVRKMLASGVPVTHTLHDAFDEDEFTFIAPADSRVTITLQGDESVEFDLAEHQDTAVGPVFRTGTNLGAKFTSRGDEQQYYITVRRHEDAQHREYYVGQIQQEYTLKVTIEPLN